MCDTDAQAVDGDRDDDVDEPEVVTINDPPIGYTDEFDDDADDDTEDGDV